MIMTAQSRAEINGRRIMKVPRASSANSTKPSSRSTGSASPRRASFSSGSFFDCACPVGMVFLYGRGSVAGCFSALSAVSQAACIELNQRPQSPREPGKGSAVSMTITTVERLIDLGDEFLCHDRLFQ